MPLPWLKLPALQGTHTGSPGGTELSPVWWCFFGHFRRAALVPETLIRPPPGRALLPQTQPAPSSTSSQSGGPSYQLQHPCWLLYSLSVRRWRVVEGGSVHLSSSHSSWDSAWQLCWPGPEKPVTYLTVAWLDGPCLSEPPLKKGMTEQDLSSWWSNLINDWKYLVHIFVMSINTHK